MKLYVDMKPECSDEELLEAIKMSRDGSMGGPNVSITVLDHKESDPAYQEWLDAGIELIQAAYYMYDGSLVDAEDAIRDMTKDQARERAGKIHKLTGTLGQMIGELGMERGLIYKIHEEW